MLYGRRFPLRLKGAVYESVVMPAILYGSEAWCLKESEMGILRRTEISMVGAMCGVHLKDGKRSKALMFMWGLYGIVDRLAMASSVNGYCHVLKREDGHVLRRALDLFVEGQGKKGRLVRTRKTQVEDESVKVGLKREDALPIKVEFVGVNQIAAWLG